MLKLIMESDINTVANNLYTLGTESGAIKSHTREIFISSETINKISLELENDKKTFFENGQDIKNIDKLWASGLQNKIVDHLLKIFLEQTTQDHTGFFIDWKFSSGDMSTNIKSILPKLDLNDLGEKEQCGTWIESLRINGEAHEFDQESETKAFDMISKINLAIKDQGISFITYDTREDNYFFLLIKSSFLSKYHHFGFSEI